MNIMYLAEGDNLVFAGRENNETVSSLYLAPHYTNRNEELCEIKNVFTKEKYRRKGNMDALMKEAFQCMQSEAEPYTFLRPLEQKYFVPYGFVEVETKEGLRINGLRLSDDLLTKANESDADFHVLVKDSEDYLLHPVREAEAESVATFLNDVLKDESDCYVIQSGHTVLNMKKSLQDKGGNLYVTECKDRIVCVFAYFKVKQELVIEAKNETTTFADKRLAFLVCTKDFKKEDLFLEEPEQSITMARIIDVRAMLSSVQCPKEFVMPLKIYDERIVENAGLYLLHCGPMGGKIAAIKIGDEQMKNAEGERLSAEGEITIENLTRFLFGCKKAEDCFKIYVKAKEEEIFANLNALKCIKKPCFLCD